MKKDPDMLNLNNEYTCKFAIPGSCRKLCAKPGAELKFFTDC